MTTRHDVSTVPLQGAYVAKQCPVRAQYDLLHPGVPLEPSPFLERLFERGNRFEDDLLAELTSLHPDLILIEGDDAALREQATARAMEEGASVILNGRLPRDEAGRRVGKPDLLLAAEGGGYRPADVKHHLMLSPPDPKGRAALARCSGLDGPFFESSAVDPEATVRRHRGDLLQLAHYQRMLEAAGLAPGDGRFGAIVGVERRVVWFDLDEPIWRTPSASGPPKYRSSMEVYDFEFDFRLDILSVAQMHVNDPSVELLVVPVRISECEACPWWGVCRGVLEAGSGDVSLLPRVGWREWRAHQERGVPDRAALASLDHRTATLVAGGIDVAALRTAAAAEPPDRPLSELSPISRRPAQLRQLAAVGVTTCGDVAGLDERTAAYSGSGLVALPEQIDQARAWLGPEPAYRRRGFEALDVPRADLEVDVDMENIEEGVYLWGTLVTDRAVDPPRTEYHPFVTWEPMTPEVEAESFLRFWRWFTDLRGETHRQGQTFLAYCYSATETTQMRRIALTAGMLDEVEEFVASTEWIDMLRVVDRQLITGTASGLKVVASLLGHKWPVEDPGGGESMSRYDQALASPDGAERDAARDWLLAYNRGDVEATVAIRKWMDANADDIIPIESLGAEA